MASENGKNLLAVIRYARKMLEQVSLLLQTCDKLLGDNGWDSLHGSTAVTESGAAIYVPKDWMPKEAFRIYGKKDSRAVIYVAAILDDANQDYKRFEEPLLTAGCFVPFTDAESDGHQYGWVRSHCWSSDLHDGTVKDQDLAAEDAATRKKWGKEHVALQATFGHPLVDFTKSEAIGSKIVKPLLDLVAAREEEVYGEPTRQ